MMESFDLYGYGSVIVSLVFGWIVFREMKKRMALPFIVNAPGALLAAAGVFLLIGWVFTVTGLMEQKMPADFGGVPWTSPAFVFVIAICWYLICQILMKWTRNISS